jgi:hypothetical protein
MSDYAALRQRFLEACRYGDAFTVKRLYSHYNIDIATLEAGLNAARETDNLEVVEALESLKRPQLK